MGEISGKALAARRIAAGMSQRDLALISGVAQPNIAAYETGRRAPTDITVERLEAALSRPTMARLAMFRERLLEAAQRRDLHDVRVFGSVARGESTSGSDVDLLVRPGVDASVFDLAGFMADAEAILSVPVDVVSDRATGPVADRIRLEAVPL